MFRIIDIAGFRITSTTHCAIEKYLNISTRNYEYLIIFTNDFAEDDIFYITEDISCFFNTLKGNGSKIIDENNCYVLEGPKFHHNGQLYILDTYEENPLNTPEIDSIWFEMSNMTFRQIMEQKDLGNLNRLRM